MTRLRTLFAAVAFCALSAMAGPTARAETPSATVDHLAPPAPDVADAGVAIAPSADTETVLELARVFVSEANWAHTPDAAAIVEVLRSRQLARNDAELLDTMRAYCPRATGARSPQILRQRWVSTLRLDAGQPAGWRILNRHRDRIGLMPLPWSRFEPRWRGRLTEARNLLEHPRDGTCNAPPQHWGAQSLDRTAIGWSEVDCGATINRFWRLPSTRRQRE